MTKPRVLTDWEQDCMTYHGRVLTGAEAHWCPEWDDLPVDETTGEKCHCCPYTPHTGDGVENG